jgi:bifunctional DNase/RNase
MRGHTLLAACLVASLGCDTKEAAPPPPPTGLAPVAQPATNLGPMGVPVPEPRPGFVPMTVGTVQPGLDGWTLTLVDAGRTVQVPMIIGEAEASVIQMRLEGRAFQRPLTHDLLDSMIERLGARVVMVEVDTLRSNTFIANIVVWDGEQLHRIDSRTSDAVAVALGSQAPIYVAQQVVDLTGVPTL